MGMFKHKFNKLDFDPNTTVELVNFSTVGFRVDENGVFEGADKSDPSVDVAFLISYKWKIYKSGICYSGAACILTDGEYYDELGFGRDRGLTIHSTAVLGYLNPFNVKPDALIDADWVRGIIMSQITPSDYV